MNSNTHGGADASRMMDGAIMTAAWIYKGLPVNNALKWKMRKGYA